MAFWGGARLAEEGAALAVVVPFDASRIDCSAYTLTLGAEAFVTPSYGDNPREARKSKLAAFELENIDGCSLIKGGGTVVIPPGQFALLLTEEVVKLPGNAMGFISLKSGPKFKGLINVSGFHVDPGFKGRLIFSVWNAGPSTIHFARGDKLFLLWIADLSGRTEEDYIKSVPGYVEIPRERITDVAYGRHSLEALAKQVEGLTGELKTAKAVAYGFATVIGLLIAVLTMIFAALALKPIFLGSPVTPIVAPSFEADPIQSEAP